jgi:hypothetical protein
MPSVRTRKIHRCLKCGGEGKVFGEMGFKRCPVCQGTGELRQTMTQGQPGRWMTYRRPVRVPEPLALADEFGRHGSNPAANWVL